MIGQERRRLDAFRRIEEPRRTREVLGPGLPGRGRQSRNAADGAFRNRALHRLESVDALGPSRAPKRSTRRLMSAVGTRRAAADCCLPQGLDAARHQHDGLDSEAGIDRLQRSSKSPARC